MISQSGPCWPMPSGTPSASSAEISRFRKRLALALNRLSAKLAAEAGEEVQGEEAAAVEPALVRWFEAGALSKALVAAGVPVMAHLGLTPQSVNVFGGFLVTQRML